MTAGSQIGAPESQPQLSFHVAESAVFEPASHEHRKPVLLHAHTGVSGFRTTSIMEIPRPKSRDERQLFDYGSFRPCKYLALDRKTGQPQQDSKAVVVFTHFARYFRGP